MKARLILLSSFIASSLFARVELFDEKQEQNISKEQNTSINKEANITSYDELIHFKSKEEDLNYLFENSKFPVDDYLWKGGFKKPTQNVGEAFAEANKNKKSLEQLRKEEEAEFRKQLALESLEKAGARKGNIILGPDGKPILDANGNPMYDNILYDENGYPILDANGNPRYKNVIYDKDGYPMFDENGNLLTIDHPDIVLDENGNPIFDENGNLLLKSSPQYQEQQRKTMQKQIEEQQKELAKLIEEQKQINQKARQQAQIGANAQVPQHSINTLLKNSILAERSGSLNLSKQNSRYGADSFSNQKNVDTATNEHKLLRTIRAGRLIPAILTTAISSDIEGLVTAQVEQDIYASMGRAVLIPRGSKVIGFYQNDNKIGQSRLNITWREIITPQGVNILLTNAIASDNLGMAGAKGEVNNKYFERYGIGYGISTLSNVLLLALSRETGGNVYAQEVYDRSSEDINTIVSDIMDQQAEIKPTIEIKQGSRIYITPTAHIWFPVPKNGEVLAEFFKDEE